MATTKIPLNFYKRLTQQITRVPKISYTTPFDRAGVVISALISNTNSFGKSITVGVSSTTTSNSYYDIVKDFYIEPKETFSLLPTKFVLAENDCLIFSADTVTNTTINDPGVFWLFDTPLGLTTLENLNVGFTTSTSVSANFGIDNQTNKQRFYNADFSDWTGHTTTLQQISGASLGTIGPNGWIQGLRISQTNIPTGTYELLKQTSITEDLQNFNNTFYSRLQINNANYGINNIATSILTPAGSALGGTGGLAVQSVLRDSELVFGKTLKAAFWARASQPTKLMIDLIFRSVSPQRPGGIYYYGGIQNRYAIFDLTTNWQKYEWSVTAPTYEQFRNEAYNLDTTSDQTLTDPNWGTSLYVYPSTDPTVSLPLSTFGAQFSIRTLLSRWTNFAAGSKMTQTELSSVIASSITNGYYDIGGLDLFLATNTTLIPLTSFVPVEYTYDLSDNTETNITLSILEADNRK
jgi:hypothetical protein